MTLSDMAASSPSPDEWNNLVKIYAVLTVVIFVKYTISLFYAANSGNHPSEDKIFLLPPQPGDVARRERQFLNDMENIPVHLAVFYAAFIMQTLQNASGRGGKIGTVALTALFLMYTMCRMLFTICYIHSIQPFRTIFYILGTFTVCATCINLIHSSYNIDMSAVFPSSDE